MIDFIRSELIYRLKAFSYKDESNASLNYHMNFLKDSFVRFRDEFKREPLDRNYDILRNLKEGLYHILMNPGSQNSQIPVFLNEHLPEIVKFMMNGRCVRDDEVKELNQINDFIIDLIFFCILYLPQNIPGVYEILKDILQHDKLLFKTFTNFSKETLLDRYEKHLKDIRRRYFTEMVETDVPERTTIINNYDEEEKSNPNYPNESRYVHTINGDIEPYYKKEEKKYREFEYPINNPNLLISDYVSPYYHIILNAFDKLGGMAQLVNIINEATSVSVVCTALELLESIGHYYTNDALNFCALYMKDKLIELPKIITEEDIKNSKNAMIKKLIQLAEQYLKKALDNYKTKEIIEQMELEFHYICFTSQNLEKRINGLQGIIDKISDAKINQRMIENLNYRNDLDGVSFNWINLSTFPLWLHERRIFDILFGESKHPELIKRSFNLIKFLYKHKKIEEEKIDQLFELSTGQHETIKSTICKIFTDLLETVEIKDLRYIYFKITQIPLSEFSSETLKMLSAVGKNQAESRSRDDHSNWSEKTQPSHPKKRLNRLELTSSTVNKQLYKDEKHINLKVYSEPKIANSPIEDYKGPTTFDRTADNKEGNESTPKTAKRKKNRAKEEKATEGQENIAGWEEAIKGNQNPSIKITNVPDSENHNGQSESVEPVENQIREKKEVAQQKEEKEISVSVLLLSFLWDFIREGSMNRNINSSIVSEAVSILKDLLSNWKLKNERFEFIQKCIASITNNQAVNESIEVLECIMKGSFPLVKKDNAVIDCKLDLVQFMENEYNLIHELLTTMMVYKRNITNNLILQSKAFGHKGENFLDIKETCNSFEDYEGSEQLTEPSKTSQKNTNLSNLQQDIPAGEDFEEEEKSLSEDPFLFQNPGGNQLRNPSDQLILPIQQSENRSSNNDFQHQIKPEKEVTSTDASSLDEGNLIFDKNYANQKEKPTQQGGQLGTNLKKDQEQNNYINEMIKELDRRVRFLKVLYEISLEYVENKHIKILWELLVVNSLKEEEKNIFFNLLDNLIYSAKNSFKSMKEEVIYYIYCELLLKIDHHYYSPKAFHCFKNFFLYINREAKLMEGEVIDAYKLINVDLIGFDLVWTLYLQASDEKVSSLAGKLLISIFSYKTESNAIYEELKLKYVEYLIANIKKGYLSIQNNSPCTNRTGEDLYSEGVHTLTRSIDLIIHMINQYEGVHQLGPEKMGETIIANINSSHIKNEKSKSFKIELHSNMTLIQAKNLICSKLSNPYRPDELIFFYRGKVQEEDNKKLHEINFSDKSTFVLDNKLLDEERAIKNAPPPSQNDNKEADFSEEVKMLKEIFSHIPEKLIKFIFEKKNRNSDDAANALSDETIVEANQRLLEKEEKEFELQEREKIKCSKLSEMLSDNKDYFELFFEILNLDIPELGAKTWDLLTLLPINKERHRELKGIFDKSKEPNWAAIFDNNCPFRFLYSLQIVCKFVSCGVILDEKEKSEEIAERKEWREKFITQGGFTYVYKLFLNEKWNDKISLSKSHHSSENSAEGSENHNYNARLLEMILELLNIYVNSYVLSSAHPLIESLVAFAIKFKHCLTKDHGTHIDFMQANEQVSGTGNKEFAVSGRTNSVSSRSNSSNITPNFHSPATSKSATPHCTTPPITAERDGEGNIPQNKGSFINKENVVSAYDEFQALVKASSQGILERVLREVDFPVLISKLLEILSLVTDPSIINKDVVSLIENVFALLFPCLTAKPELIMQLYDFPEIDKAFAHVLISCRHDSLRKTFSFTINSICANFQDKQYKEFLEKRSSEGFHTDKVFENPSIFFLKMLLHHFLTCEFQKKDYEDYFICVGKLLNTTTETELKSITNPSELFERILELIYQRPINEERMSDYEDKVLAGLIYTADSLLKICPDLKSKGNLSEESKSLGQTIYDYLFYMPTDFSNELVGESKKKQDLLIFPKCKKRNTRKRAFELLITYCTQNESNFNKILEFISNHHENVGGRGLSESDFYGNAEFRPTHGFVGLRNLHSTCYINSLVQQLSMIDELRDGILEADLLMKISSEDDKEKKEKDILIKNENLMNDHSIGPVTSKLLETHLLYQLKRLFADLSENVRQYINPQVFISCLRGEDSQPVNVHIQQDVNEFYNILLEQLEKVLKGTKDEKLLQEALGGKLSHEIISMEGEYPYYKETEEPYLTLSLEIKHKNKLQDAMDLFVQDEVLDGDNKFFCDEHKKKIKVKKRCCIKTLPKNLVLTLKRFEFDYNTMLKMKINDYFEFPMNLNLKSWTKAGISEAQKNRQAEQNLENDEIEGESLPDSYYEYELVGVLVHSGTAEAGHYYSFIKVRHGRLKNKWFEFNDTHVTEWDIAQLRNECFGGEYDNHYGANSVYYESFDNARSRNAYLLFYERTSMKSEAEELQSWRCEVPRPLRDLIWQENLKYLKGKLFYDYDYFRFLKEYLFCLEYPQLKDDDVRSQISYNDQQLVDIKWCRLNKYNIKLARYTYYDDDIPPQLEEDIVDPQKEVEWESHTLSELMKLPALKTFKLIFIYSHEMLLKMRDSLNFIETMNVMINYLKINTAACFFVLGFFTDNQQVLSEILFEYNHGEVKTAVAKILRIVIEKVAKVEEDYILEFEPVERIEQTNDLIPRVETTEIKKSSLVRFLDVMLRFLENECKKYMNKTIHYFEIFKVIVHQSPKIAKYLNKMTRGFKSLVSLFLSCFVYSTEPSLTINSVDTSRLNEHKPGELIILLDIISNIVCTSKTIGMKINSQNPPTYTLSKFNTEDSFELDSDFEDHFLSSRNFEYCFQPLGAASKALQSIIQHCAWGREYNSDKLLTMIVDMICMDSNRADKLDSLFPHIEALLMLEDNFQSHRVRTLFKGNKIINFIECNRQSNSNYRMNCIRWLVDMSSRCPPLSKYMKDFQSSFTWMVEYIDDVGPNIQHNYSHQLSKWQKTKQKLMEILEISEVPYSLNYNKEGNSDMPINNNNDEEEKTNTLYFNNNNSVGLDSLDNNKSGC